MSRVAVIGDSARVAGFVLAGATVLETDTGGAEGAWDRLPDDTGLVVLTREAADALRDRLDRHGRLLWAVLPA